jgi:hypothetical protein
MTAFAEREVNARTVRISVKGRWEIRGGEWMGE